jgi:hypothetical protein
MAGSEATGVRPPVSASCPLPEETIGWTSTLGMASCVLKSRWHHAIALWFASSVEEPSPHSSIDAYHITLLLGRQRQFPGDLEGGAYGSILVSSR